MHGRPLPDGPAPSTALVELTFDKRKVERWIRFGRKSYEQIIDRRRSVVGFAPESVFAFVRWAAGEHGTVISRIDIVRAIGRGEPFQTLPFVRPGGRSEEHTSELQSLMRISYAVFCLNKKKTT